SQALHRRRNVGKVDDRDTLQPEGGVKHLGGIADAEDDPGGVKPPLGMRNFARSHRPVVQQVFLGAGLGHLSGGKVDGVGRGESRVVAAESSAGGSPNVVELPRLAADVVLAVAGGNVHIPGTAIQGGIAGDFGVAGDGIVGYVVPAENPGFELDLHGAAQ